MLIIPNFLKKSDIAGIGIFTAVPVKKGEVVWQESAYEISYPPDIFDKVPDAFKEFLKTYSTPLQNGTFHLCCDNSRFLNHSKEPSLTYIHNEYVEVMVASWDLNAGDELTCNYTHTMYLPNGKHPADDFAL